MKDLFLLLLSLPLLPFGCNAFLHSQRLNTPSKALYSSRDGGDDDNMSFTYVEGSEFDNPEDEIEALGGDPFFLMDDDDDDHTSTQSMEKKSINSGQDKNDEDDDEWEWDGEVDENAHLDLDID